MTSLNDALINTIQSYANILSKIYSLTTPNVPLSKIITSPTNGLDQRTKASLYNAYRTSFKSLNTLVKSHSALPSKIKTQERSYRSLLLHEISKGERWAVKIYYLHCKVVGGDGTKGGENGKPELCNDVVIKSIKGGKGCLDVVSEYVQSYPDLHYYTLLGFSSYLTSIVDGSTKNDDVGVGKLGELEVWGAQVWKRLIGWGKTVEWGEDGKVWFESIGVGEEGGKEGNDDEDEEEDGEEEEEEEEEEVDSNQDSFNLTSTPKPKSSTPRYLTPKNIYKSLSQYLLSLTRTLPPPSQTPNLHCHLLTTLTPLLPNVPQTTIIKFSPYLLSLSSPTHPSSVRCGTLTPLRHLVKNTSLGAKDYYGYLSSLCVPCVFNSVERREEWMNSWRASVKSTMNDGGRVKEIIFKLGEVGMVVGEEGTRGVWEGIRIGLEGREGLEREIFNSKGGRGIREILTSGEHWWKGVRDTVKGIRERKRRVFDGKEEGEGKKAMKIVGEWEGKEIRRREKKERTEAWMLDGDK